MEIYWLNKSTVTAKTSRLSMLHPQDFVESNIIFNPTSAAWDNFHLGVSDAPPLRPNHCIFLFEIVAVLQCDVIVCCYTLCLFPRQSTCLYFSTADGFQGNKRGGGRGWGLTEHCQADSAEGGWGPPKVEENPKRRAKERNGGGQIRSAASFHDLGLFLAL